MLIKKLLFQVRSPFNSGRVVNVNVAKKVCMLEPDISPRHRGKPIRVEDIVELRGTHPDISSGSA